MPGEALESVLDRWKGEYRLLLEASENLLRNFDTVTPDETASLLARRQESIDRFQNIDASLQRSLASDRGGLADALLEEFRAFQKSATDRILELDALVMALATERMNALRGEMAGLSRRKQAAFAYEDNGRIKR